MWTAHDRFALALAICTSACGGIVVVDAKDDGTGVGVAGVGASTGAFGAGGEDVEVTAVGQSGTGSAGGGGGRGSGAGGDGGDGGAACPGGPCVIATGFVGADIEIDESHIYVTTGDGSTVLRLAKLGTSLENLAQSDGFAGSISLAEGEVFWGGASSVLRAPKTGGPATVVVTPGLPIGAIVLGGSEVFFVDRQAFGSIRAVPSSGGEMRVVVPYASLANDIAFVRGIKQWDAIVWGSTDSGSGELHELLLDGVSEPMTLLGGMDTPGAVLHGSEGTYVTEPYVGTVSRADPSGIGVFLVGTVDLPAGLAVDDRYLYITEAGTHDARSGRILRLGRFEATGIEVVAENLHSPRGIVADEEAIYWLEGDPDRALMRLAND